MITDRDRCCREAKIVECSELLSDSLMPESRFSIRIACAFFQSIDSPVIVSLR